MLQLQPDRRHDDTPRAATGPDGPTGARPPGGVWRIVAGREIGLKVRDKGFALSLLLTIVSIALSLGAAAFLGGGDQTVTVATSDATSEQLVERAGELADDGLAIDVQRVRDDAAVEAAVEDDEAELGLVAGGNELVGRGSTESRSATLVQQAHAEALLADNAAAAGIDLADLEGGDPLATRELQDGQVGDGTVRVAAIALAGAFYLCALMFGALVAQSVLEEKQNRIVEIVASLIPLRSLLLGKIVGSAVVASIQVAAMAGAAVTVLAVTGAPVGLPELGLTGIWFALFFAVGYLSVAALWAMAGALATRQEDLQHTATPVSILLIIVVPVGLFLSGTGLAVASYVPIANVVAMPARVLAGEALWWEPFLSLAVLAAFSFACVRFAAHIYRRSLMQTRSRLTVRDALRLAD
ncbi:ABC transporter permease [Nocardioides sp. CPCC 205120]|uniref:ABC transporter permease n=1 Tax=Nocardioides sp. CPCC 205120 TaxID=3406462 RepID=UPI003B500CC2